MKILPLTDGSQQDRRMDALNRAFRVPADRWLARARAWVAKRYKGYTIIVTETFRTTSRQQYLFAQNRRGHWVTSRSGKTGDFSLHQFGIALDFALVMPNGETDWDGKKYKALLAAVPLADFGLETLAPDELVHIQLAVQRLQGGAFITDRQLWAKLAKMGITTTLTGSSAGVNDA